MNYIISTKQINAVIFGGLSALCLFLIFVDGPEGFMVLIPTVIMGFVTNALINQHLKRVTTVENTQSNLGLMT
jgi:hypothetical protein